jgi:hypothetical protein
VSKTAKGSVVNPASATVEVEGKPLRVTDGSFRYRVKLAHGVNYNEVIASAPG